MLEPGDSSRNLRPINSMPMDGRRPVSRSSDRERDLGQVVRPRFGHPTDRPDRERLSREMADRPSSKRRPRHRWLSQLFRRKPDRPAKSDLRSPERSRLAAVTDPTDSRLRPQALGSPALHDRRRRPPLEPPRSPDARAAQLAALRRRQSHHERPISLQEKLRQAPPRPLSRKAKLAVYATRLVICGIGVGVLVGTAMAVWDPATRMFISSLSAQPTPGQSPVTQAMALTPVATPKVGQEIAPLKSKVQAISQPNSQKFTIGLFMQDMDKNDFVDVNGGTAFAAASTIKIPILLALFQDIDAGKLRLDDKLTLRKELVAQGSGEMQYEPIGSQYTVLETAKKMIVISDNTATNMIIDRLGGVAALNERFKSWGLTATHLANVLPDLPGTNKTSAKDLALLMARLGQGELISLRSRDRVLNIMQQTVNNSLLPQGLGDGATISHKTGDIASALGDAGLVDMPNGKRYAVAVLVKRPENDYQAADLINQLSKTIYQHLNGGTAPIKPAAPASPESEEAP